MEKVEIVFLTLQVFCCCYLYRKFSQLKRNSDILLKVPVPPVRKVHACEQVLTQLINHIYMRICYIICSELKGHLDFVHL